MKYQLAFILSSKKRVATGMTLCRLFFNTFLFSAIFIFSFNVKAALSSMPDDGAFIYQLESEYFTTSANYDSDGGGFDSLPSGNSYSILKVNNTFGYNLSSRWQILSGLNFAFAASTDSVDSRSNSAPSDIMLGVRAQFKLGPVRLSPRVKILYPFQRISATSDATLISEGAIETEAGLNLGYHFGKIYLNGYAGFVGRDEGRASLMRLSAEAEWKLKRLHFGLGIESTSPVTDDTYTDSQTTRTNVTNAVNAQSLYFYSVNPSLIMASFWGRYKFSRRSSALLGLKATVDGANSAQGYALFAAASWAFNTSSAVRTTPKKRIRREALDDFKSQSQGYDESLFKESKTKKKRRKK